MRSLVHDPVVPIVFAVAAESTRPAALSVRAAMVSAAFSALLHAPSAPTHSASESLVNRSAWPVMIQSPVHGGACQVAAVPPSGSQWRSRRWTRWQGVDQETLNRRDNCPFLVVEAASE